MRPRTRPGALIVCLLMGLLAGCQADVPVPEPVIVASADTPQQRILGTMTVCLLEDCGYAVVDKTGADELKAVRAALEEGTVDICWDYTARTWLMYLKHDQPIFDAEELYDRVRSEDKARQISWIARTPLEHVPTLLVRSELVRRYGFRTIGDVADHMNRVDPDISLCTNETFYQMPSGVTGLERVYGCRFDKDLIQLMPLEESYQAAAEGICDCVLGYPLDVDVQDLDLEPLEDERAFFQASNLAVAIRTQALQEHPELEGILAELAALLDQDNMGRLLREVADDKEKTDVIVKRFLGEHELLGRSREKSAIETK